ncbi:DUF190 domain-containing protein [Streptomyces sp. NPDC052225]|uniref:DUF190 domain-containing protein n=1 Tax=Streptomyces sp. NPDC052225 TaxID=3154949 RepID=UPI00341E793B
MRPPRAATRLTVHLPATALWHRRPAYAEIVHRAHRTGLAGATVLHAVHSTACAVIVVDEDDRVRAFLAELDDVLETASGVAILDRVEVVP